MSQIWKDIRNSIRSGNTLMGLLVANVAAFIAINLVLVLCGLFLKLDLDPYVREYLGLPSALLQLPFRAWTLITYAFIHEGLSHIFFNMLFMYWFGQIIQEYIGERKLLALYFLGALAGAAAFVIGYNTIPAYRGFADGATLIGASGAVYAIVIGAATLTPNYQFNLLFIGPVRIVYIAAFYILVSFMELRSSNSGGNLAHLGGALMGYLFITQLRQGNDWGRPIYAIANFFGRLTSSRPNMRVTYQAPRKETVGAGRTTTRQLPANEFPDQAEIDALLDKVNAVGYEKLSTEEKQKLFKASQRE